MFRDSQNSLKLLKNRKTVKSWPESGGQDSKPLSSTIQSTVVVGMGVLSEFFFFHQENLDIKKYYLIIYLDFRWILYGSYVII